MGRHSQINRYTIIGAWRFKMKRELIQEHRIYVLICPNCKTSSVVTDDGGIEDYNCDKCGAEVIAEYAGDGVWFTTIFENGEQND